MRLIFSAKAKKSENNLTQTEKVETFKQRAYDNRAVVYSCRTVAQVMSRVDDMKR
jgi:hypothetical protein